jgi:hypothetical protein
MYKKQFLKLVPFFGRPGLGAATFCHTTSRHANICLIQTKKKLFFSAKRLLEIFLARKGKMWSEILLYINLRNTSLGV